MRIGILGGSFDPPTSAHLSIAQQSINEGLVDKVWIMPCPKRPGKTISTAFEHRFAMCKLMFNQPNIKVSDFQYQRNLYRTIDSYDALIQEFKNKTFSWIIGEDCADEIETWKDSERLIKEVPFIIFKRDWKLKPSLNTWYADKPLLKHKEYDNYVSSTLIRKFVEKKFYDLAGSYTKKEVIDYIRNRSLYEIDKDKDIISNEVS